MSDFNIIRYRAVIEFLTLENVHLKRDTQSNDRCLWWKCAVICHSQTLGGRVSSRQNMSLEDDPLSGRPSDAVCEENCHTVENIVMQNRRVNVHQIADTVGITTGSVKTILHEDFFMTKVCARWVPRMLDQKMKDCLCKTSNENLRTHAVELGFFHAAHSNRWWDLDTPLWPWDQTTKHAVEDVPVLQAPASSRFRHQLVR